MRVCLQCFVPHGSPKNTPTLRTLTSGCSVRTFVSQPVLCCQQWREGVGLVQFYSTSCYSTLDTEPGKCLTRHSDWEPAKPAHKTQVWRQSERVSGEELGPAFLSLGHNSLPCKQRKSCRPIAGCSTWAKPELQKRDLAAHIKAS